LIQCIFRDLYNSYNIGENLEVLRERKIAKGYYIPPKKPTPPTTGNWQTAKKGETVYDRSTDRGMNVKGTFEGGSEAKLKLAGLSVSSHSYDPPPQKKRRVAEDDGHVVASTSANSESTADAPLSSVPEYFVREVLDLQHVNPSSRTAQLQILEDLCKEAKVLGTEGVSVEEAEREFAFACQDLGASLPYSEWMAQSKCVPLLPVLHLDMNLLEANQSCSNKLEDPRGAGYFTLPKTVGYNTVAAQKTHASTKDTHKVCVRACVLCVSVWCASVWCIICTFVLFRMMYVLFLCTLVRIYTMLYHFAYQAC
jgi:hypothetical protein